MGLFYETSYMEKLETRCETIVSQGLKKCQKSFNETFSKCVSKVPPVLNSIICLPLKLDTICGVNNFFVKSVADVCDPSKVYDSSFGREFVQLKEKGRKFTSNYGNVSINYKTSNVKELRVVRMINGTTLSIEKKLEEKTKLVEDLLQFLKKFMAFVYLKVLYGSFSILSSFLPEVKIQLKIVPFTDAVCFHDDYLRRIEFDNVYITNYFKRIDRRRVRNGRKNVLPMKNVEMRNLVDLDSSRALAGEFDGYFSLSFRLFLQVISTTFFVLLDRIFFELLDVIARHSRVNYLQEGTHNFNIDINGTGFIANLIRSLVDGFNTNKHIKVAMTNKACLPHPLQVSSWRIIRIYLLFLFNLYLIYNQVYIHRSKRFVCAYFYPKREKARVLYLYNRLLQRRKNAFKLMERKVEEKLKIHVGVEQKENFFQVIYDN